ncbi:MAG: PrsW family intramembrane metalloprotease [Anaerolineae bacterium]|nr:PrsW family intramembrane metalloprotease [Anaerolineae bacterium]
MRRSLWTSSLITLAGLALFVGISALVPRLVNDSGALFLSVFLAAIPALIWLGFFYQQDRAEPEPKHLVVRVFVFGALAATVMPLVDQIAGRTISQLPSLIPRLLLTILTISLMQETLKAAMVRYVVLGTREFDYHQDGIIYGLASGLGFATILTLAYFLRTSGVIPLAGAIRSVNNALVHGALGAVSGYYIGRVKLDGKKAGWLLQGLGGVTIINGFYTVISDELTRRLTFNPWYSLGAAFLLAVVVGLILFAFFRRAELRTTGELQTVSVQSHARSKKMPWDIHERYDYILVGAIILALVVGWIASWVMTSRTVAYSGSDMEIQFRYPTGWAVEHTDSSSITVRDLTGAGTFKPAITISINKARSEQALDLLVAQGVTEYSHQKLLYTEIERNDETQIAKEEAIQIEYQYATSTASSPVVVQGIATYVLVNTRLYVLRYEAEIDTFSGGLKRYQQMLHTTRFAPEQ